MITRRGLLVSGAIAGGGLVLGATVMGAWVASFDELALQRAVLQGDSKLVAQWITIAPDGRVTLLAPHTEMGQGAQTSLLQILLDELDADPDLTTYQLAPADPAFTTHLALEGFITPDAQMTGWTGALVHRALGRAAQLGGIQFTGGSSAIRFTGWRGVRHAAACARMMLVSAGATHLGVAADQVVTRRGQVRHPSSGTSVGYGELAAAAAQLPLPDEPVYKDRSTYEYIGKPFPRIDIPEKVFGEPVYGIDRAVDGMRFAAVAPPPIAQGRVTGVGNRDEILAMRGVEAVVQLDDGVAVVADNPWRAEQAARKLIVNADPPKGGLLDDKADLKRRKEGVRGDMNELGTRGEGLGPLQGVAVEAEYSTPYYAHVPMEPLNCTVWEAGGKTHVATGVQGPLAGRNMAAQTLGVGLDDVVFHAHTMGGGFGRRNGLIHESLNWIRQACQIQQAVGGAVKMTWSRQAGIAMSTFHPGDAAWIQATVDDQGWPTAWHTRLFAPLGNVREAMPPYRVPSVRVESAEGEPLVPFGYWRSVAAYANIYFIECFVDELAQNAGADPVAYRRALLRDGSREQRVLDRVAQMADWKGRVRGERGYGVAFAECFGSIIAVIAEVSVDGGKPVVHRVWSAIDCGTPVNPGSVETQTQGGIYWGLSAALYGKIEFVDGAVVQSNFHDYRVATFRDGPRVYVDVLESPDAPMGGAGEVSTPLVAPALANALAALTDRPRDLPLLS